MTNETMWTNAKSLAQADPELNRAIEAALARQEAHIELHPSENYPTPAA